MLPAETHSRRLIVISRHLASPLEHRSTCSPFDLESPMKRCDLARALILTPSISLIFGFAMCLGTHAKTLRGDVVTMKNGDRLTGELRGLNNGILFIETDYSE